MGLALANFTGTYLLVEPNEDAIMNVVCIHAKVMPHARIIGLRMDAMALALVSSAMLQNITGVDPSKVRLLVGNHAIDDMILAATFSSLEQVPPTPPPSSLEQVPTTKRELDLPAHSNM